MFSVYNSKEFIAHYSELLSKMNWIAQGNVICTHLILLCAVQE